ncbi:MAG: NADH-quinone oxidoreductase subunit A [Puniceicoccales bacterium]|nr:NADH-quinone oxidoreductase subunit A [Puniceicoccales bacterium]
MSPSEHPYAFVALYLAIATVFPFILLSVAWLWARVFQPPKKNLIKNAIYECGLESPNPTQVQFKAHYYLYAILFLVFDVEVLFLLPFCASATLLPTGALLVMLLFIFLLAEGLVWAWSRGHLEWK